MYLDLAQCAEVNRMLSELLEAQQQDVNAHPAYSTTMSHTLGQRALLSHCLAMLWFLCNDHKKVNSCPLIFKFTHGHTSTYNHYMHTCRIGLFI